MASFNDVIKQARDFWSTRNTQQKGFLLAGAGATVLLLTMFVRYIDTPDYKPLFTGLEEADAQAIGTKLDGEGIPHQTSADGKTISVPASKLDAARLKTAGQNASHGGRMGFELFDKVSWGQTEFDQKVTYQRALEGELERTIETISDVESARVHLVMPTDSVFLDKQRAAKASVILKLRGRGLPKDAALTISRLVAGAVDELSPEDVSIVDAESARSLSVRSNGMDDGEGLETTLTQRLVATLEPVVGADKIRASVNVDHNLGSSEESKEEYDPEVSALLSSQKSEEVLSPGAGAVGVPGTASNTPTSKEEKTSNPPVQTGGQNSKSETAQYGVNKVVVRTVMPAGRIERVTAAILVDDATVKNVQGGKTTFTHRKRTPEELSKIRQLAEAVVGFDSKRGDTISVENMSFDSMGAEADLPALNWLDKGRQTVSDYSSLLRPVSLLVVFALTYLLVVRPVQKQALKPTLAKTAPQPILAPGAQAEQLSAGSDEPEDNSRRAAQLKEQTIGLIRQKPVNTARALQTWLREEPS